MGACAPLFPSRLRLGVTILAVLSLACGAGALESNLVGSVCQGVCQEGDFAANLATARTAVKQALEGGSQFPALPECFLSGYDNRQAVPRGARALDEPDLARFIAESAGHDMMILAGLARRAGPPTTPSCTPVQASFQTAPPTGWR